MDSKGAGQRAAGEVVWMFGCEEVLTVHCRSGWRRRVCFPRQRRAPGLRPWLEGGEEESDDELFVLFRDPLSGVEVVLTTSMVNDFDDEPTSSASCLSESEATRI